MELIILVWLACAGIGAAISHAKGRGMMEGLILGGLLGLIGVIIAACMSQRTPLHHVPSGMVATQCYRCNAVQNVPAGRPHFECWQCKIANSTPGYVAPPQPRKASKALESRKIRCFDCGEVQHVPGDSKVVPCRECGARMKLLPKTTT